MSDVFGFMGQIARVNLTTGETSSEDLHVEKLRMSLGGRGIGAQVLFDELEKGIDPLGPRNKLVFATGPLTGTPFSGNARYGVYAKSPLTGMWGESYAGGFFGPELKFAGYDAVILEGRSEDPVYVWIKDGEVKIMDANRL